MGFFEMIGLVAIGLLVAPFVLWALYLAFFVFILAFFVFILASTYVVVGIFSAVGWVIDAGKKIIGKRN